MTVLDLINWLERLPDTMKVEIEGICTQCGERSCRDLSFSDLDAESDDTLFITPPYVDDHR